jgi:hypothetical protein
MSCNSVTNMKVMATVPRGLTNRRVTVFRRLSDIAAGLMLQPVWAVDSPAAGQSPLARPRKVSSAP